MMTLSDYQKNISVMTNDELIRERQSVNSLLPYLASTYPIWVTRAVKVEKEMIGRALITVN